MAAWLTVSEAVAKSGFHRTYINKLIHEGRLKSKRIGPIWTIATTSLETFMAQERKPGRPPGRRRRRKPP